MGYICTWTLSYIVILQHQVGSKFIKCTYKSFHYTISPAIFMNIQFIWVIIGQRLMVNWSGMILNWNLDRGKIFGKVLEDQSRLSVNVSHGHWFTELILHPDCQISNWSNLKIRWGWAKYLTLSDVTKIKLTFYAHWWRINSFFRFENETKYLALLILNPDL